MKTSLASHFGAISVDEHLKIENAIIRNYSLADFTYFYILHHNVACLRVSLLLDLVEPVLRLSLICQHFHSVFLFCFTNYSFFRENTLTLSQIVHLCGPKKNKQSRTKIKILLSESLVLGGRSSLSNTPLFAQSNQRVFTKFTISFISQLCALNFVTFGCSLKVPLTSVQNVGKANWKSQFTRLVSTDSDARSELAARFYRKAKAGKAFFLVDKEFSLRNVRSSKVRTQNDSIVLRRFIFSRANTMLTDFAQAGDWVSTLNYIKFYKFEMKCYYWAERRRRKKCFFFILFWALQAKAKSEQRKTFSLDGEKKKRQKGFWCDTEPV